MKFFYSLYYTKWLVIYISIQKVGDFMEYNGLLSSASRVQANINALINMSERAHSISKILDSVTEDLMKTLDDVKKASKED